MFLEKEKNIYFYRLSPPKSPTHHYSHSHLYTTLQYIGECEQNDCGKNIDGIEIYLVVNVCLFHTYVERSLDGFK